MAEKETGKHQAKAEGEGEAEEKEEIKTEPSAESKADTVPGSDDETRADGKVKSDKADTTGPDLDGDDNDKADDRADEKQRSISKPDKADEEPARKGAFAERLTRWFGDARFVPAMVVAGGLLAAAVEVLWNPYDADLKSLEVIRAGESLGIDPTIHLGLYLGALIAMVLLGVWLLLGPWWARLPGKAGALKADFEGEAFEKKGARADEERETGRDVKEKAEQVAPSIEKKATDNFSRGWFWLLVILAVLAGGILRYPRLSHSFWNDEEVAHRKFIHGTHRLGEDGELKFVPVSWKRTWFYNVTGNNHVLQSVASRATLDLFGGDERGSHIDEPLTRMLPLAAGLLTIVALAVLLRQAGAGLAGVLAAWLLALHPWHLRYSVEARGYSMMLLFAVLMFVVLSVAMRRKSWAAWTLYGLCQLACLMSFPAAIYLVATINVGVLLMLAVRRDGISLKRWSTVGVVGAAVFFQVMTPSLLRMVEWIGSPYEVPRPLNAPYFLDLWSHVAAGMPLADGHDVSSFRLDLDSWQKGGGLRYWLLVAVLPALVVVGCLWALVKRPRLRWPLITVLAATGLAIVHVLLKPMVFHGWYLLYLLLPFCIGLAFIAQAAWDWKRPVGWMTSITLLLVYGVVAMAPIKRQRDFERHPMRTAVMKVRGEAPALSSPQAERMTVSIGPGSGQLAGYDPRVIPAKDEAGFFAALDKARAEGREFAVYCTRSSELAQSMPQVASSLSDASQFREMDHLLGVEAFWSIRLYEWPPPEADESAAPAD